jgi:arsenate reductase
MTVTIYHNPECGTSRNTLAMIRQSGVEPTVIEYLKNPPSRERIVELISAAGVTLRQAIRQKDAPHEELGLGDESLTDNALLDAIGQHPVLLNRPCVETPIGTRLCRPSEVVLDILENPDIGPFIKKDGQVIIDTEDKRIV